MPTPRCSPGAAPAPERAGSCSGSRTSTQGGAGRSDAGAILEDLAWLGLDWDGPVRVQSAHLQEYRAALDALRTQGLLYPCFCTRAEILREIDHAASAPHTPDGSLLYPGTCRGLDSAAQQERLASGAPYALRLDIERALARVPQSLTFFEEGEGRHACHPERFGDVVLARKDSPASYHLCVTHDDAVQGVNLVTRGADLKPAHGSASAAASADGLAGAALRPPSPAN